LRKSDPGGKEKKKEIAHLIEGCVDLRNQVDQYLIKVKYALVHKATEFKNEFELIIAETKSHKAASAKKKLGNSSQKSKDELLIETKKYLKGSTGLHKGSKTRSERSPPRIIDFSFMPEKSDSRDAQRFCFTTNSEEKKKQIKPCYINTEELFPYRRDFTSKHKRSASHAERRKENRDFLNHTVSGKPPQLFTPSFDTGVKSAGKQQLFRPHQRDVSIKEDIVSIKQRINDIMSKRLTVSLKTDMLIARMAGRSSDPTDHGFAGYPKSHALFAGCRR
jgi:hypothetical protein